MIYIYSPASDVSRFQEPSTEPCVDASPSECHDPTHLATMCSDCEYAQYCRKSCGLCQGKYNLYHTQDTCFLKFQYKFMLLSKSKKCHLNRIKEIYKLVNSHFIFMSQSIAFYTLLLYIKQKLAFTYYKRLLIIIRDFALNLTDNGHNGVWYENVVLFDYDPVHKTCRHSSSVDPSICQSITQQNHHVSPVMENNTTLNHAHAKHDYLILVYYESFINLHFRTNGEPITNLQLSACQTTGHGRVDILLNNQPIQQSYTGTDVWNLRWQIHNLDSLHLNNTREFDLKIQKDSATHSYGHYWISRIRVESTIAHHVH